MKVNMESFIVTESEGGLCLFSFPVGKERVRAYMCEEDYSKR